MNNFRPVLLVALVAVLIILSSTPVESAVPSSVWRSDFASAQKEAQRLGKPMVVHFYAHWCGPCQQMERDVLNSPDLLRQLRLGFVAVKLDADKHPDLVNKFGVQALPTDVFVDPDGRVITRHQGFESRREYLARLTKIETDFAPTSKVFIAKTDSSKLKTTATSASVAAASRKAAEVNVNNGEQSVGTAFVGLSGYSPVSLAKSRTWNKGNAEFAAEYQGITYHFVDANELALFRKNAAKFAPRLLGCDPVKLWESDRAVPGNTQFGAYFDGELYLFATAESRKAFKSNPLRYTRARHVLRPDDIQHARL